MSRRWRTRAAMACWWGRSTLDTTVVVGWRRGDSRSRPRASKSKRHITVPAAALRSAARRDGASTAILEGTKAATIADRPENRRGRTRRARRSACSADGSSLADRRADDVEPVQERRDLGRKDSYLRHQGPSAEITVCRCQAGVASMAWRTARIRTNAPPHG